MAVNTRREFVVASLATAAAATTAHAADTERFFTPPESALVETITGLIIPRDQDPGAIEAGVVHYIDLQLRGPLSRFAPLYRSDLKSFEPLRTLGPEDQVSFLKAVERGEHGAGAARLFNLMIDHTMQGFYGSPTHGGNQDEVSWKMLGIEREMGGGHSH